MVVGAIQAGLSISESADLLGFFTENGPKKRKYPVCGSCVDGNALLMSEVREEWEDHTGCCSGQLRTGHGGYN